jgi:hypothetical protein
MSLRSAMHTLAVAPFETALSRNRRPPMSRAQKALHPWAGPTSVASTDRRSKRVVETRRIRIRRPSIHDCSMQGVRFINQHVGNDVARKQLRESVLVRFRVMALVGQLSESRARPAKGAPGRGHWRSTIPCPFVSTSRPMAPSHAMASRPDMPVTSGITAIESVVPLKRTATSCTRSDPGLTSCPRTATR